MATAFLEPSSDVAGGQWAVNNAATAAAALAKGVTQPTTPSTSSLISSAASGQITTVNIANTLGTPAALGIPTLWMYSGTTNSAFGSHTAALVGNGTTLATASNPTTSGAWTSAAAAGNLTQAQLAALQVTVNGQGSGLATETIYAIYVTFTYTPGQVQAVLPRIVGARQAVQRVAYW